MATNRLPRLIWEQLTSFLPPVYLYEVHCIIGEDLVDQTLELKSEIISILELANNDESLQLVFLNSPTHPVDEKCFSSLNFYVTEKSKQENPDQVIDGLNEKSELECCIQTIRNALLTEISSLKTYLQDIQNSFLANFNKPKYEQENISHSRKIDSTLSKSKTVHKNSVTNKKLSCGLEFLLGQDSLNGLLYNPTIPYSPRFSSSQSSVDNSSSPSSSRAICQLSTAKVNKINKNIDNKKRETKQLQNGKNPKLTEQVCVPVILNPLKPNSAKQLKQSFSVNKFQTTNQRLSEPYSNRSFSVERNFPDYNRCNSAQRFRQMILKARQESENC
ncbi:unnamed protein product [Schistosoma turkestanicum]|nr:unnamed protein product [Schistosoma turkestanicum]